MVFDVVVGSIVVSLVVRLSFENDVAEIVAVVVVRIGVVVDNKLYDVVVVTSLVVAFDVVVSDDDVVF